MQGQTLVKNENDLEERKAVLEIVVRLNEKEQKLALHVHNLNERNEKANADLFFDRERELEQREEELFQRQRDLEEREFEMNDKTDVFEFAIHDYRKANIK